MMYYLVKRLIDIFGSIFLLIIFSPIMIITIVVIKLTSEGPVFADTPKRVGQLGKPFYAYKLRSMIVNAHQLLRTDPRFRKALKELKEGGNYKVMNDPRVTPIGRIIRKHSIDEIPQLLNVIKGEMSIVGPRPYYEEELEIQQQKFPGSEENVKKMLTAKPGITGFWQVSGRSNVTFDKRIAMDAFYAEKRSIWLDIFILIKTPLIMITGKGAA